MPHSCGSASLQSSLRARPGTLSRVSSQRGLVSSQRGLTRRVLEELFKFGLEGGAAGGIRVREVAAGEHPLRHFFFIVRLDRDPCAQQHCAAAGGAVGRRGSNSSGASLFGRVQANKFCSASTIRQARSRAHVEYSCVGEVERARYWWASSA